MSELQSPLTESNSSTPPQEVRSGIPKVMGILHIVFASVGIVMAMLGLFSSSIMKTFNELGIAQTEDIMSSLDKLATYTTIDSSVKIILGILLLISGIKLLKYQTAGLKLSNMWAFTRIIWAIIFTAISFSAQQAYQNAILNNMPDTSGAADLMNSIGTITMILGILMLCVYPILSLILLNKASVKKVLN